MEQVMVPHRLNSISSLHLDTEAIHPSFNTKRGSLKWPTDVLWYWKGACDVLSKMQGLQNLKISLTREKALGALGPRYRGVGLAFTTPNGRATGFKLQCEYLLAQAS